jgi:hypothetical protein
MTLLAMGRVQSLAGALVTSDRLETIMATMRPRGYSAAATVSNYRPQA